MHLLDKRLQILLHVFLWSLLVIVLHAVVKFEVSSEVYYVNDEEIVVEKERGALPLILWGIIFKVTCVYGLLFWVLPRYFIDREKKRFIKFFLVFTLVPFASEILLGVFFLIAAYDYAPDQFKLYLGINLLLYVLLISLVSGYCFVRQFYQEEKMRKILENEKLATELQFLKSQINPHFLFNTLNNLFSMAQDSQDQPAANGILKLSGLMRYMLYESNHEKVDLQKEVEYVLQFIELQQYRIGEGDQTYISFELEGDVREQKIVPMLIIPFVENAFKHGLDLAKESFIQFRLTVEEELFRFSSRNTIHRSSSTFDKRDSGVGLDNVIRRLDLLYPEKHEIKIEEKDNYFLVELTLDLSH